MGAGEVFILLFAAVGALVGYTSLGGVVGTGIGAIVGVVIGTIIIEGANSIAL